jgi:hypothetical protein
LNHVHLVVGAEGNELNALGVLSLPGVSDHIAPTIQRVVVETAAGRVEIATGKGRRSESEPVSLDERSRVFVDAFDRMDGNAERRRLGLYRVGYQFCDASGAPSQQLGDVRWSVRFDRLPRDPRSARVAYGPGSMSGYTPTTVFSYEVTSRVADGVAQSAALDCRALAPGRYTLRVVVEDYFGNATDAIVPIVVSPS